MHAVVIASNCARADICFVADFRVAQITQVHRFRAPAQHSFFRFHKISDARSLSQHHAFTEM